MGVCKLPGGSMEGLKLWVMDLQNGIEDLCKGIFFECHWDDYRMQFLWHSRSVQLYYGWLHSYRYTKRHTDYPRRITPAGIYYSGIELPPNIISPYWRNTSIPTYRIHHNIYRSCHKTQLYKVSLIITFLIFITLTYWNLFQTTLKNCNLQI